MKGVETLNKGLAIEKTVLETCHLVTFRSVFLYKNAHQSYLTEQPEIANSMSPEGNKANFMPLNNGYTALQVSFVLGYQVHWIEFKLNINFEEHILLFDICLNFL